MAKAVKREIDPKVQQAIAELNKKYNGSLVVMGISGTDTANWTFLPSGSLGLDIAVGAGIPEGAPIVIQGKESIGKTMIALMIAAEAQKQGHNIAIIDAEQALNPAFARKIGLFIPEEGEEYPEGHGMVILHQPQVEAEKTLNLVDDLIESGIFKYIIIDSVPALVPKAELEGEFQDQQMSLQARLMAKAMRKYVYSGNLRKSLTTLLIINQLGDKIGAYVPTTEAKGGKALRFASIVTMEGSISKRHEVMVEGKKVQIGHVLSIKIAKNKVGVPYRTAEISIYYDQGIDRLEEVVSIGILLKVIEVSGSWFKLTHPETGEVLVDKVQGRDKLKAALVEKPEVVNELIEIIRARIYE